MTDFCLQKVDSKLMFTQLSIDFRLTRFTMTAHSDQVAQKGNFGQSDCECSRNKLPHLLFGPVLEEKRAVRGNVHGMYVSTESHELQSGQRVSHQRHR
jgi:hypothetical protein